MIASIHRFLNTGHLGELCLHMTPDSVAGLLGAPERTTDEACAPIIWVYGSMELMFEHGRLISIEVKLQGGDDLGPIEVSPAELARLRGFRLDTFCDDIQSLGAQVARIVQRTYMPETTIFLLSSGVRVVFEHGQMLAVSAYSGPATSVP